MGFIFNRKKKVSKDGTKVDIINYSNDDNRAWEPVMESGKYLEEMTEYIDEIFPCQEEKPFKGLEVWRGRCKRRGGILLAHQMAEISGQISP